MSETTVGPVIVGIDGSPASINALRWGGRLAERTGAELIAVSVWRHPAWATLPNPIGVTLPPADLMDEATARIIETACEHAGISDATQVVRTGSPAFTLGSMCLDLEASALVVGSGVGIGVGGAVIGSVAASCVRAALVPTIVVPADSTSTEPNSGSETIVVAYDGSEGAERALEWAAGRAAGGSEIELAFVWDVPAWPILGTPPGKTHPDPHSRAEVERVVDDRARALADELGSDVTVTAVVLEGRAGDVIADRSRHADLLVVGSASHGGLEPIVVGSVAIALTRQPITVTAVVPPTRSA